MKLIYVDESGVPGQSDWLILGSFIIDVNHWPVIQTGIPKAVGPALWYRLDGLKDLRSPNDCRYEFDRGEPKEASHRVYDFLDETISYDVITVLIHQETFIEKYGDTSYERAYRFLLERVQMFLEPDSEYGIIFIDKRGKKPDEAIQSAHDVVQGAGTQYVDIDNIIEVAAPINDAYSLGIQLSDWIASGVKNHFVDGRSEFYDRFAPNLHSHKGTVSGVGVKIFPDKAKFLIEDI